MPPKPCNVSRKLCSEACSSCLSATCAAANKLAEQLPAQFKTLTGRNIFESIYLSKVAGLGCRPYLCWECSTLEGAMTSRIGAAGGFRRLVAVVVAVSLMLQLMPVQALAQAAEELDSTQAETVEEAEAKDSGQANSAGDSSDEGGVDDSLEDEPEPDAEEISEVPEDDVPSNVSPSVESAAEEAGDAMIEGSSISDAEREAESSADSPLEAYASNESTATSSIAVGDAIELGTYKGSPITWVCVAIDDKGPLMLSKDILCDKAYDANGEDATYHGDGWGYIRKRYGSNCWEDSNLRQWLNSSGSVEWTHCPPTKDRVKDGLNPYDDEDGFLTGFTDADLKCIKTVYRIVYVNSWESNREGYTDGGTRKVSWHNPKYTDLNLSEADSEKYWYRGLHDKIFLLGSQELYEVWSSSPEQLRNQDHLWWTSLAMNGGASYEHNHAVDADAASANGTLGGAVSYDGSVGVRPAFYLDAEEYEFSRNCTSISCDYLPSTFGWGFSHNDMCNSVSSISLPVFQRAVSFSLGGMSTLWFGFFYAMGRKGIPENGFCHGMAVTSVLSYLQKPAWSEWSSTDGATLPKSPFQLRSGWDSIANQSSLGGLTISEWIQAIHCTQFTYLWSKASLVSHSNGCAPVVEKTIAALRENKPIVYRLTGSPGNHSVVAYRIDGPRQNGDYRIYVYDANEIWPEDSGATNNVYITINPTTNEWSYDRGHYGSSKGNRIGCFDIDLPLIAGQMVAPHLIDSPALDGIRELLVDVAGVVSVQSPSFELKTGSGAIASHTGELLGDIQGSGIVPIEVDYGNGDMPAAFYIEGKDADISVACESDGNGTEVQYAGEDAIIRLSSDGDGTYTVVDNDDACESAVVTNDGAQVSVECERDDGALITLTGEAADTVRVITSTTDDYVLEVMGFEGEVTVESTVPSGNTKKETLEMADPQESYVAVEDDAEINLVSSLSNASIKEIEQQTYTGNPIEPKLSLEYGGRKLVEGEDYVASYANNTNVGEASVSLTGKGKYAGTAHTTFEIVGMNVDKLSISNVGQQMYTGKAVKPMPTVSLGEKKLKEGTDYELTYNNNIGVGTATVTVTGKGNYIGSSTADFKITPAELTTASIAAIADQGYTGSAIKPAPTVKLGGATLKSGTDYTLSYKSNTKVGTATVTVSGKGNYAGTKSATFRIVNCSGASRVPVSATARYTCLKGGYLRVKSGGRYVRSDSVVSISGWTVTGRRAGRTTLYLFDSRGRQVERKTVTVYSLAGSWELQSSVDSGYVLDIRGKSKANSARMIVWPRNGGKNQRYQFVRQSDGTYGIKCVHSGKYVDVQGGGTKKSQPVIQYTWNGGKNQRWKIAVDSENRVTFVSAKSGMVFDIQGGKVTKRAQMIQYPANGGNNQKWVLNKK